MEQQIRLRWTSHQGTIMSVFDALLTSESLVDVTLACEEQYIRAHKIILSACSPYFQALINIDANKHPIFFLKDVKFAELKAIIQYMYRGEVSISQEDLPSLLAVAQALKIRGLADVEREQNSISSDTIILPDSATKNRVMMPTIPPPPVSHVPPPSAMGLSPMASSNVQVPRSFQQVQSHATSASSIPITTPVPTSGPPAKKTRMETRQSTQTPPSAIVQKQSQMVDPLEVDSPTSISSHVDPLQTVSVPVTSTPYKAAGHPGHSQDMAFGNRGMVEDAEPFTAEVMKLEPGGAIDIDLEEEENSMSQSSFSEPWQMGDGDNSQMADDDGELAGGSGNNDGTGAEGGEGFEKQGNPETYGCPSCSRTYATACTMLLHYRSYCSKPRMYCCDCGYQTKKYADLKKHSKTQSCRRILRELKFEQ